MSSLLLGNTAALCLIGVSPEKEGNARTISHAAKAAVARVTIIYRPHLPTISSSPVIREAKLKDGNRKRARHDCVDKYSVHPIRFIQFGSFNSEMNEHINKANIRGSSLGSCHTILMSWHRMR